MSSPISSFSGVVSGVDWQSLVDKIIQADGAPQTALKNQVSDANQRLTAWQSYGQLLQALQTAGAGLRDGSVFTATTASVTGAAGAGSPEVAASTSADAGPGQYQVQVVSLAAAEKVSGASVTSAATALGLTGEFYVNGARISVAATDTLSDIRDKINAADTGSAATKVTATVLTTSATGNRLVLTSDVTGSAGVDLKDDASGLLVRLGLLDGTTTIKRPTSSGAAGDRFAAEDKSVASLLGADGDALGPQTVTIDGQTLTIDLSTQSLDDIAASINTLSGVSASVQQDTSGGATRYYLDVRGTTSLVDGGGHALELLGLLEGGRAAVAQQVAGGAVTAGDAATPATAATLLTDLWNGGAAGGALDGDTLTVTGTRGDGSAVALTYTIHAGDTVQTLLDRLNSTTDGFGAGLRPAQAALDAQGRITLTDGTGGDSRLALSIVAHNEGGGRLDFGAFTTDVVGRQRTLIAGADATFRVDGVTMQRASNTVSDAIAGVTLSLQGAQSQATWTVNVARDVSAASSALNSFTQAYNDMVAFVVAENTPPASGASAPPLFADSTLSGMRSTLSQALIAVVPGLADGYATASSVGLSLDKNGQLSFDASKFQTAFTGDYAAVQRLFVPQKSASDPDVSFETFGDATAGGSYAVAITAAATQAAVTGSGFSGVYADDGTPDTMVVTDKASGWSTQVALADGMTAAQIATALNTAFAASTRQRLASGVLYGDPAGTTPMTATTRWADLTGAGGAPLGVTAGDTITYNGTRGDGSLVTGTFAIGDPASGTVGDLVAQLQQDLGSGATVSVSDGQIVVEDVNAGGSSLALTLTAGNQGGGSLALGALSTVTAGRGALPVTADASGGQLALTGASYGSAAGFSVSFLPGGADGTGQLGIAAQAYAGRDVAGTIGGFAASGAGQQLTGATGTPVAGLTVTYGGTAARAAGSVTLTLGLAEQIGRALDAWLDPTNGLLALKETATNDRIASLNDGIATWDTRLAQERTRLTQQYSAMETAIAKLQAQSSALSQFSTTTLATASQQSSSTSKGVLG